jgi:hypothetical protein
MSTAPPTDPAATSALLDLQRATHLVQTPWALIGGQALIAYGVPRHTEDADALVPRAALEPLADLLVETFGYTPLVYDEATDGYVEADAVTVHYMDDPVLFDVGEERAMVPLRSPLNLHLDILAAQHPVEQEMIELSTPRRHQGVQVPLAPLGGILLVKTKADRPKDTAAIEQAAEFVPQEQLRAAIAWARRRDPATADELQSTVQFARTRRAPKRTEVRERRR